MLSTGALGVAILYVINFATIITIIFFRRKDMSTTFAWVLLLLFLPAIGFLFYFFLGSTKKLEMLSKKYNSSEMEKKYMNVLNDSLDRMKLGQESFRDPKVAKYRDMLYINAINAKSFFTDDNQVELLVNGQEKFPKMFEEMRKAKSSINVMYFIYKTNDEIGKEFTKILTEKAKEGVTVRVLYDGLGCLKTKMRDFKELKAAGGKVQRFLPSVIRTLLEANYRLHRKMVIIDGKTCYTGGINVGDDYLGKYPKITPWRDTSIRVVGKAVWELQLVFFKDWVFCARQNKKTANSTYMDELEGVHDKYFPPSEGKKDGMGVQIIQCGPDNKYAVHKDSYVKMCTAAKNYLYIQSPYFVPDQTLLDAIRMAAQAGIDVRMMIPGIPDKKPVYNVAMSYVEELLEAGVRIYKYRGFIHSKTFVLDDFVSSVGTTNLDIRSFKLDYEVNAMVYSEDFAVKMKETFLKDIESSDEINLEEFKKRGNWQYIKESVCRFITPLA